MIFRQLFPFEWVSVQQRHRQMTLNSYIHQHFDVLVQGSLQYNSQPEVDEGFEHLNGSPVVKSQPNARKLKFE